MLFDKYITESRDRHTTYIYFPLSLRSFALLTTLLALVSTFFFFEVMHSIGHSNQTVHF